MIIDTQTLFSDDQAITATAASTNILDLGATGTVVGGASALGRDIGKGTPVELLIQWTVAAASAGASTVTVDLETDDNAAFSSATVLASTGAIAKAVLVAGYQMRIHYMPRGAERYIRLNYTVGTANLTAGKVSAGIVAGVQTNDV